MPHEGDRFAVKKFCEKNGPSSTTSAKKGSLMARLKQRLCANGDGDEPPVKKKHNYPGTEMQRSQANPQG